METRDARGGVLVLGGGFAGAYVARLLGRRGATIVSPENFMLFTPLLLEAADAAVDEAERRRHLAFVFVGAGYAGVEALAELADLVEDAARYYPRLAGAPRRWVLVDAAPKILPEIPSRLGEYAARELEEREVEIHVETTVESVSADEVTLGDALRIPTNTLVWTAGGAPTPPLRAPGVQPAEP